MKILDKLPVRLVLIIFISISMISLCGCQTLKRKFTRKAKSEKENVEEVIYEPQEYPAQVMSNEDMYRLYYNFWRGWQQELMEVLSEGQNHKKQVECITELINNLNKMKDLLVPEVQTNLSSQINELLPMKDEIISGRGNATNYDWMKIKLDSVKKKISQDYIPRKIKSYIIR